MRKKKSSKIKVKGEKILKNGAVAGYVYYSKEKKWKWRIIGRHKKGGSSSNGSSSNGSSSNGSSSNGNGNY